MQGTSRNHPDLGLPDSILTLFNIITSTKALSPNTITLKLGLQFQEDKMQSVTEIPSSVSFFLCGVGLGWNIYMYTCINVCV